MTVTRLSDGTWAVVDDIGQELSLHATNADAWKWIERQSGDDYSPVASRHNWSFMQWTRRA